MKSSLVDRVKLARTSEDVMELVKEGAGYKYISTNTKTKLRRFARERLAILKK